ncbi:hypothetical protein DITRI_Ditri04bG0073200 [Diplodiscus trichospermus]
MSHPIGGCSKDFKSYIGALARINVDINIDDWKKYLKALRTPFGKMSRRNSI